MRRKAICAVLAFCLLLRPETTLAWSEGAHHVIGLIAFDSMTPAAQKRVIEILRAHPRFGEDFKTELTEPKAVGHFMLGTASYWPDTARDLPQYHRSTWHYQLGASLVIGNPAKVPANPGRLPDRASCRGFVRDSGWQGEQLQDNSTPAMFREGRWIFLFSDSEEQSS